MPTMKHAAIVAIAALALSFLASCDMHAQCRSKHALSEQCHLWMRHYERTMGVAQWGQDNARYEQWYTDRHEDCVSRGGIGLWDGYRAQ
jgi:hypothetical protein